MELIHALYEPAGKGPHPTILTLHGRGANALDLLGLAPYLGSGRFLVICPQGPLETPIGAEATGYAWYPMSKGGSPDVEEILTSRQKLQQFLDGCSARYPIDAQKLAVLGFSQGGVMAYSLALANPEHFAALVALSSWLPPELLGKLSLGDSARSLPTLIQHGTEDSMIEVERARHSVEIVRQAGLPLTYREYQMGHEIRPKSLSDLSAWLEENVLSPVVISK
jgi:phospholipase/carboxylesterase